MDNQLPLIPLLSEKTYGQSEKNVYVVKVAKNTNKTGVKRAIESQFDVKVASVNILNVKGKSKRTRRVAKGRNSNTHKAYVTLKEGFSLPFFAAIEEEEKQAEKVQEELTKQQQKEDKPKRRARRTKAEAKETK